MHARGVRDRSWDTESKGGSDRAMADVKHVQSFADHPRCDPDPGRPPASRTVETTAAYDGMSVANVVNLTLLSWPSEQEQLSPLWMRVLVFLRAPSYTYSMPCPKLPGADTLDQTIFSLP